MSDLADTAGVDPIDFDATEPDAGAAPAAAVTVAASRNAVPALEAPPAKPVLDADAADDGEDAAAADGEQTDEEKAASDAARTLAKRRRDPNVRIGQAVAKQRAAEAETARLAAEVAELKAGTAKKPAPSADDDAPDAEADDPDARYVKAFGKTPDDFESYDAYVAKLAIFTARQIVLEADTAAAERGHRAEAERVNEDRRATAAERLAEFKQTHADWDDLVAASDLNVHEAVMVQLERSPHGAPVIYHLLSDPAEADRFGGLSVADQLTEIGRLESRFLDSSDAATAPTATARVTRQSAAPRPMSRAVGGGAAASSVRLDQMDPDDYIEARNKEVRAQGRRF